MSINEVALVVSALAQIENKSAASFFNNKYEKNLFFAMFGLFILILVVGFGYFFSKHPALEMLLITLTLVFYLVAMCWQIALVIPAVKFFKNPTGQLLQSFEESAAKELATINSLSNVSPETIEYLSDRLILAKEQLNKRMAFLIGAVEKIGLLPGLVASLLALSKLSETKPFSIESKELYIYGALAFFIFYAFSMVSMLVSQKFEVYSGVLKHYLKARDLNKSSDSLQVLSQRARVNG